MTMTRCVGSILACLLLANGCAATRAAPDRQRNASGPVQASAAAIAAMERAIFEATNRFREDNGLAPLAWDDGLGRFARSRSEDMARRRYFSHTEPGGTGVFTLMRQAGIRYRYGAENIHMSRGVSRAEAAETAMRGWINSPGHRANMLAKQPTHLGVGVAQAANGAFYSTQVFTRP